MNIVYRAIESIEELEQVVDLEIIVWDLPARDATPAGLLHAMVCNGSLVLGAFDGDKLIGMALMFPSSRHKYKLLWSHMAAVHPDYQGQGVGFGLKQFQRSWALENGYNTIGWTFDPLQRGNANFNLHVLGGLTNTYHVNFYGVLTDGLNAGLPSDRLEIMWALRNPRVKQLSMQESPISLFISDEITQHHLLLHSHNDTLIINKLTSANQFYLAEIPQNINQMKRQSQNVAISWRLALRETLQTAFLAGYTARDLVTYEDRPFYLLMPAEVWYLYVLECVDQTLYTGISPDVSHRVKSHNNGRGAAYTKTRRPVKLIAAWQFPNRREAMQAEIAFKQLTRQAKLNHITYEQSFRNAAFVQIDE